YTGDLTVCGLSPVQNDLDHILTAKMDADFKALKAGGKLASPKDDQEFTPSWSFQQANPACVTPSPTPSDTPTSPTDTPTSPTDTPTTGSSSPTAPPSSDTSTPSDTPTPTDTTSGSGVSVAPPGCV